MIQFNLLPDVKLEFVKAERTKHAVVSGAVITTGVTFLIFALLFATVHIVQKKVISDQTASINDYSTQLKNTPSINQILTVQNQLNALPALNAGKPAASRTFDLLQQLTPPSVALTDVVVDYDQKTVSFEGKADKLSDVNTLADTIKYTDYLVNKDENSAKHAFSNVVLSDIGRNTKEATFTITASYDPVIYDNASDVSFSVPAGVSTASVLNQPTFTSNKKDASQ